MTPEQWAASGIGLLLTGLVGTWMQSIHRAADRAAASAAQAADALVKLSERMGVLTERSATHAAQLDELGSDVRLIRESTAETAREGQAVAALVARHAETLEALRCQREEAAGHG